MTIGLVVPVFKNFPGFAELIESVDEAVVPIIIPNWRDNLGVSKGWNAGMAIAISKGIETVIIVGDDVVFRPQTISKITTPLDKHLLVTATNERDGGGEVDEVYVEAPDYSCFAIRPADFVNTVGWFDENFTPAYFEDNDMAYRVKLAGKTQMRRLDAPMFHKGSVTQNWGGTTYVTTPMFEKNRYYYESKWGGSPGAETFTSPFDNDTIGLLDRVDVK